MRELDFASLNHPSGVATDFGPFENARSGSIKLTRDPWPIEFRDVQDRLLITTFAFVRRASDLQRTMPAAFSLFIL